MVQGWNRSTLNVKPQILNTTVAVIPKPGPGLGLGFQIPWPSGWICFQN